MEIEHRAERIEFVYPVRTAEFSVTGRECSLRCPHCNALFLRNIERKNARSCLVTGGCNSEGEVPLAEHVETLRRLAGRFRLIAHTGLIGEVQIKKIAPLLQAVSFNFMSDDETIREVYGLQKSAEDYIECYCTLRRYVKVYPHITIGLNKGEIVGEKKAIETLGSLGADAVIFNILIPTPGTRYASVKPPSPEDVTDVLEEAMNKLQDSPIFLGCMRPGGEHRKRIDEAAVELGVNRIVMPSRSAVQLAKENHLVVGIREECCIL